MNQHHKVLLEEIKRYRTNNPKHEWVSKYLGTPRLRYGVDTPTLRKLSKDFIKNNPLPEDQLLTLLDDLFQGQSFEERAAADYILFILPKFRQSIHPNRLDSWLNNLQGWAEVDSLCQNNFNASEILSNFTNWSSLLRQLNRDKNISKRRASLVLLNKAVGQSNDQRLADLAFENIDHLKEEKDILITKAISWLLRSLINNHRNRVEEYLKSNVNSLPKIALRETTRKLQTGKK